MFSKDVLPSRINSTTSSHFTIFYISVFLCAKLARNRKRRKNYHALQKKKKLVAGTRYLVPLASCSLPIFVSLRYRCTKSTKYTNREDGGIRLFGKDRKQVSMQVSACVRGAGGPIVASDASLAQCHLALEERLSDPRRFSMVTNLATLGHVFCVSLDYRLSVIHSVRI